MTRDWRPGATISASTIRIHTLDAVFFISVRKARKRLDRASWLVSCRLVSFPSFWIWGNCPNWTWGVLANDEHPGSSHAGQICATFEIHTVELEDNHSRSLHRTIIAHPHQPTSHFTPPVGFSQLCLLLRLTKQSINPSTAPERPPANQTVQLSHPVGERLDPTGPALETSTE